jgi:hypothetical protein
LLLCSKALQEALILCLEEGFRFEDRREGLSLKPNTYHLQKTFLFVVCAFLKEEDFQVKTAGQGDLWNSKNHEFWS